jgi:transketolase
MKNNELNLVIGAIRALSIDATNLAKSGHPGMPIGSAPLMATLFANHMVTYPKQPTWINRDRFVLSAGHASMLLYATLHLAGYNLSIDDIKAFRQLGSITPGHPEVHMTPGVDATTGPLGQGIAQAVGMALAERTLRNLYKRDDLFGHYTYVLSGDGCLQEGISQEAMSFAAHQKLSKLILFYDANDVTLDGPLHQSFSEDVKARFLATGWNVMVVKDGEDTDAINKAIKKAKRQNEKPTMIMIKTVIGRGSINQGTYKVHGNPLGEQDGLNAKQSFGWNYPPFEIPTSIYESFQSAVLKRGKKAYRAWEKTKQTWQNSQPEDAKRLDASLQGSWLPSSQPLVEFKEGYHDATRNSSLLIIQSLAKAIPAFVGGSADVAKSVMTTLPDTPDMSFEHPEGRNIHFGIREFAMASIQNGMVLHGGLRPFTGTFLAFADYMKPAIRLAALSHLPSIFVFSHDSVALGEDGPTHQPIDQLAMLRAIPNIRVYRPADAKETLGAWLAALQETSRPSVIVLSRQKLPLLGTSNNQLVRQGGYMLSPSNLANPWTVVATGSEVSLALEVQANLAQRQIGIHVVSMPSLEAFLSLPKNTQTSILQNPRQKVISLEALSTFGWSVVAETTIGIDTFGVSAPGPQAMAHFGFEQNALTERLFAIITANNR